MIASKSEFLPVGLESVGGVPADSFVSTGPGASVTEVGLDQSIVIPNVCAHCIVLSFKL